MENDSSGRACVADLLLQASAISYASACEAWQARYRTLDQAGRDELARAIGEARAQLQDAAHRYAEIRPVLSDLCRALGWQGGTIHEAIAEVRRLRKAPAWTTGARCLTCNFVYGAHEGHLIACPLCEARSLRDRVAGLESFKRSVDEALNSGDGSYRP